MNFFSYIKKSLIPIYEVSHLIAKGFVKLGNDNNKAKISFSFNKLKAFSCFLPYLKPINFLSILIKYWNP
jgi:hypothetical protein